MKNKVMKSKTDYSEFIRKSMKPVLKEKIHIVTREKVKLTNVYEYELGSPLKHESGLMQISFLFEKIKPKQQHAATARSNKLIFPEQYKEAFNQCYKRALAQINFSPDSVHLLDVCYIYWLPV